MGREKRSSCTFEPTLICASARRHPTLLVRESRPHEQHNVPRIECTVASNAVGHHSRLPYGLSGDPDLPMVMPFDWNELDTLHNGQITAASAAERLAKGDLCATLAAALAHALRDSNSGRPVMGSRCNALMPARVPATP